VLVWSGDRTVYLGEGMMVGFVTVYAFYDGEGALRSSKIAEEKPEGIPDEVIRELKSNPKIELDSGGFVYGCQVWWKPVESEGDEKSGRLRRSA